MTALAVILARAGSKGVPGKNSAMIAGRPCAAWTIDAAMASRAVARTVLSTDDPPLLALARGMGIQTILRPPDLASDTATVDDAARHAVAAADPDGSGPIVILYANVPVRPAGLIDRALEMLKSTGADSVQSYCPVGKHHPWWTVRVTAHSDKEPARVLPWEGNVLYHGVYRRQELPPAYVPDGGVVTVTRRALFLKIPGVTPGPHAFLGLDRRAVINPEGSVVDIDSKIDLLVAEAILKEQQNRRTAEQQIRR